MLRRGGFAHWREFKQRLLVRFSDFIDDEPETRLFSIKQTGTVTDYVSEFEELLAQVPDLADHHLERLFYNGLSLEMKEVIQMKDPQGLQNFIAAVLRMETSAFCKIVCESNAGSTPVQKSATGTTTRTQGPFIQNRGNQDRSKWAVGDNKQLKENGRIINRTVLHSGRG